MESLGFTVFDTAIGRCALVWGEHGLVGTYLPESNEESLRARIAQRFPDAVESAPGESASRAIDGITALLAGEKRDLLDIALNMSAVPPFHQRVYEVARAIPPGETLTYGEISQRLGAPREAARAVGEAMGRNPFPIVMPCHRVLGANGKPGGFSAPGGVDTKLKMLAIEGAKVGETPTLFDDLPLAVKPTR